MQTVNEQTHFLSMFFDVPMQSIYIYFDCPNCKAFSTTEYVFELDCIRCPKCKTVYKILSRMVTPFGIQIVREQDNV